jgi:hypothetical protein
MGVEGGTVSSSEPSGKGERSDSEEVDVSAVFISYRRSDTGRISRLIGDYLESRFGDDRIFMDVFDIDLGIDFHEKLAEKLARCDVMLIVIGPEWLSCEAADGSRRIDKADDYVRIEIEAALGRKIPLVPVFVDGVSAVDSKDLPDELRALAKRNGIQLRQSTFEADLKRLADGLSEVIMKSEKEENSNLVPDPFRVFRSEFTEEKVRHQLAGTWGPPRTYGSQRPLREGTDVSKQKGKEASWITALFSRKQR